MLSKFVVSMLLSLRFLYIPLLMFMAVAMVSLVIKGGMYVHSMILALPTESLGRVMYYSLALLDVTLVIGLLLMIMGYIVFNFVLDSNNLPDNIPAWFLERFAPKNENILKVKIAVTILLIATIDLLGEFVALSDVDVDRIVAVSSRLWLMLGLFCALVVTAVVLVAVLRFISQQGDTH